MLCHLVVAFVVVLTVGACSSDPSVDEVLPGGTVPEDQLWCGMFGSEAVQRLLGDGDLGRVRQFGDFAAVEGSTARCNLMLADGAEPERLMTGIVQLIDWWPRYRDDLVNLRSLAGEGGQRVASGGVVQVEPGVYVDVERHSVAVYSTCETEDRFPALMIGTIDPWPTETGDPWTRDELEAAALRLSATTTTLLPCPGVVRGLEPGDGERLLEDYLVEMSRDVE